MKLPHPLYIDDSNLALATDFYEITMAAGYWQEQLQEEATFELFVRHLPPNRGYLLLAGLEQALHYLTHIHFDGAAIDYLLTLPALAHVRKDFFDYLAGLRFTGSVKAIPEGTVVFGEEPLLQITAPIIEAQIVETYLISTLMMQTMVASKAARVVAAAAGRPVVDFGSRRAHGPQAALLAARACYIAGCAGTSNILAAQALGIPPVGTAAHSWTMAHDSEKDAFAAYCQTFPQGTILLIDTYDTLSGARHAAVCKNRVLGVRLDSGDMIGLSREVRRILDDAGMTDTKIFASGDLNETKITEIIAAKAPIDAFGVGTEMVTSRDEPTLGCVYKLVQIRKDGHVVPKVKWSEEKASYPLAKQVFRHNGADTIGLAEEKLAGETLLIEVMRQGKISYNLPDIAEVQACARTQIAALLPGVRRLEQPDAYPVHFSAELQAAREALRIQDDHARKDHD